MTDYFYNKNVISDEDYYNPCLDDFPYINAGCCCFDTDSNIFEEYKNTLMNNLEQRWSTMEWIGHLEQSALTIALAKKNMRTVLEPENNLCLLIMTFIVLKHKMIHYTLNMAS